MILSLIVAMDEKRGIGHEGKLPWRLSADLRRFKQITMGHHVVMGRKTYESIGRILPGRKMLILSRDSSYQVDGCLVVNSIDEALKMVERKGELELFFIGGAEIFAEAINLVDKMYLTLVHASLPADVYFPHYDPSEWEITVQYELEADQNNEFPHTFMVMNRKPAIAETDR